MNTKNDDTSAPIESLAKLDDTLSEFFDEAGRAKSGQTQFRKDLGSKSVPSREQKPLLATATAQTMLSPETVRLIRREAVRDCDVGSNTFELEDC